MSALVGVIMGSKSDWSTLSHTADMLEKLGIPYEVKVVSAHRTPDLLFQYAEEAEGRGIEVIIAGAGGAAHLPGMCAAKTHLPVLGVPVQSSMLSALRWVTTTTPMSSPARAGDGIMRTARVAATPRRRRRVLREDTAGRVTVRAGSDDRSAAHQRTLGRRSLR